jgi:hypothetical protein
MLHACLYTIYFIFCYTSWHFYAFSRTNLLTRCHSASFLFSAIFVFQKSYTGNILRIGQNKSRSFYFSWHETESKADTEGSLGPATPWGSAASPWPTPPGGGATWPTYWCRPSAYIFSLMRKPKTTINFSWNILQAAVIVDARSGGSRSSFRHPIREGNHHQRPSSSPCLHPE